MIYFISDGEYVKVGVTTAPTLRLSELQIGNPRPLVVMRLLHGGYMEEGQLHIRYTKAGLHVRGEWFRAEGPLAWCAFTEPPAHNLNLPVPALLTDDEMGGLEQEVNDVLGR